MILEKEKYRYQAALSDLSGSDIKHHNNEEKKLMKVVRDWFITEELGTGANHSKIWDAFNVFNLYLFDSLSEHGYSKENYNTAPIP